MPTTTATEGAARQPRGAVTNRGDRARLTRTRIVDAARETFVARGYRTASLRDVATAAGISHPGLLKHFATKDELLAAVVESFEAENQALFLQQVASEDPGALAYSLLAQRNATIPGYLPLFAALTGEASTRRHPAHERMRARYADLRDVSEAAMEEGILHDTVAPDRDPRGEAIRVSAAWDGLQVLEQYLPDRVDLVGMLEQHESMLALPVGWREPSEAPPRPVAAPVPPLPDFSGDVWALGPEAGADVAGYRVGRERRARIVADATALFAEEGYGDTSLRDIAERVGVSKSTLLHHYASKEQLLRAVLAERDRGIQDRASFVPGNRAADELRALPRGAAENATDAPGLIEVYAVLSCEAVPADHPAHAYFAHRYTQTIDHFAALFDAAQDDGDLPAHRDPEREAVWLVALWDGLQYQWLYDRDAVDVAAELTAHLDDVLPPA